MRERGQPAQVDRHPDLRGVARAGGDVDGGRDAGTHCGRAQQRGQAARLEHRRIDALRKQRRLVERLLDVATHLLEERLGRRGIGVRRLPSELQIDCERDEVLMHAIVQVTLDAAAVGIRGHDEPLPDSRSSSTSARSRSSSSLHVDLS